MGERRITFNDKQKDKEVISDYERLMKLVRRIAKDASRMQDFETATKLIDLQSDVMELAKYTN